jgi:hypothetical protein
MKIITMITFVCALGLVAHAQDSKQVQGFSVVLLRGEPEGTVPSQGLSPSAQRALTDIKEFLPFKGYRVLDTQWVAGSSYGESQGRLRIDEKDYEFALETRPAEIPTKPGVSPGPLASARFILRTPLNGYGISGNKLGVQTMLDNQFAIKPGETVVVGTSRTQGNNALIVLLTAVRTGK